MSHSIRHSRAILLVTAILLIGFGLRTALLGDSYRFHPDEALFSTFARRAALNGDWLLHGDLDKPPLTIYANALSMLLIAARPRHTVLDFTPLQGEFAARLPSLFASLIMIAAAYSTAVRLFRHSERANWTTLFISLSPLAVVFSPTAFTDGLMLCAGVLSLRAAAGGQWSWAGFWLGAAFAAKQQGIFFLPLGAALGWVVDGLSMRRLAAYTLPFIVWIALLFIWDNARSPSTSYWALAAANNAVTDFIQPDEAIPRLVQWAIYSGSILGTASIPLTVLFVLSGRSAHATERRIDRALLAFAGGYVGIHWLVAFNTYDRYALLLLLPVTLLAARGAAWAQKSFRAIQGSGLRQLAISVLIVVVLVLMSANVVGSASGHALVGGDAGDGNWGQYEGIDSLASYLNSKPVATVIYDRWLGWEMGYYLGEWNDKRRVYFPTPEALGKGASALHETAPRYFVAPIDQPVSAWLEALRRAGFSVRREIVMARFIVYRVEPLSLASFRHLPKFG